MDTIVQNTTTGVDINPIGPSSVALGRTAKSADETEMRDSERDQINRADMDRSMRARAIARRQSMPNGEWMIRNDDELRKALSRFMNPPDSEALSNVYGPDEIQRHIINRARLLQLTGLLPTDWSMNAELDMGRQKRIMLQAMEAKADEAFLMTCEQLEAASRDETSKFFAGANHAQLLQASRFFSAAIRRKYASRGIALPDGSFPIPDKDALRRAIRLVGKGGAAAKRHIIKRARAMGATGMLPPKWGVGGAKAATAEVSLGTRLVAEGTTLYWTVPFNGSEIPYPAILQGDEAGQEGFIRIKAPFYIGGAITRPPGIDKRVRFPSKILQETVREGNKQIAEGKQPLTVYARHAKALSGNDLPIGGIVKLTAEGTIGYAFIDIANKGEGEQVVSLMKHDPPLLNAVSLRSGPERFDATEIVLDEEPIYDLERLLLDGVDFAPDSPAQPTHGIQVLTAETAREQNKSEEDKKITAVTLTLETLKTDHPSLVEELTGPLMDQIDGLRQEVTKRDQLINEYREKERKAALDAYVIELAGLLPDDQREAGLKLFQEIATEAKTREAFSTRVLPTLTRLLSTGAVVEKKETDEEKLMKLWPTRGGNGQVHGLTQEAKTVGGTPDENVETAAGLEVPA